LLAWRAYNIFKDLPNGNLRLQLLNRANLFQFLSLLPLDMARAVHPRNPWISNNRLTRFYLWTLRRKIPLLRRILGGFLGSEIDCELPERIFLPHPYGIIVGGFAELGNDVTLMQQVTLGGKDPWCQKTDLKDEFPKLREGVYVGAGAKILGSVTIGAWAVIGANAVVTKDVPAAATVVGHNHIIPVGDSG